jgi:hypothetical protein
VTQGAAQSYTITPNAGYAIATLTVDGSTVATSATYTFANVQASHTIGATFSATAPGGIVLSLVPARTSGVAPLAVFFDASATTDTGVTTRPFHDLEYTWSFGDAGAGTWASGAQPGVSSKNSATGPVAAHVFETPGTYTVTLTAFDGTNTATTNTTITVTDPNTVFSGTNTICVAQLTTPTAGANGCPTDATVVMESNFATIVNTYALTNRRVLLKRGDTFTAPTTGAITRTGPGILGAYGSGAAPKVQTTNYNTTILRLSSQSTPDISDWRVMDLEIDGSLVPDAGASYCTISPPPADPSLCNNIVGAGGAMKQTTFLRLSIHDTRNGFQLGDTNLDWWNNNGYPGHVMFDQVAIVDSSVLHSIGGGGVGVAFSGNRLSMLGNIVDDTMRTEHVVRIFYLNKGVIGNNTLSRQAPTKAVIKMHGPTWCSPGSPIGTSGRCTTTSTDYLTAEPPVGVAGAAGGYTEQVVVSDNKLVAADGTDWTFTIRPQNAISDERIRNVIVERNWFVAGNTSSSALVINAAEVTARNNICDASNGVSHKCFLLASTAVEPPATDVHIYNNTFYSASAGNFIGVDIRAPAMNTTVTNNLGSAPLAAAPAMVIDAGTNTVQGSNLLDTPSALFVSATPAVPADFILKSLPNPARNAGTVVPVWSDFFRTSRPQSGVIDMGAVERP